MANIPLESITFPGLSDKYTVPLIDTTLAVSGRAADAKATGDAIADVVEDVTAIEQTLPAIENTSLAAFATDTASGAIATFPDGADLVPVKSLTVEIEPVQSGSGDPSPTNVRPISGWSEAKVTRTGKNLLDPSILTVFGSTYVSSIDYATTGKIPVKPSTQYVLSFSGSVGDGRILQYDASGNLIGSATQFTSQPYYFTTDAKCVSIGFRYKFTETSGATVADSKAQMEIGSTASSYEAYHGQTYTIDLSGTRYGGTLDVGTGVLTVDRGVYVSDGTVDNRDGNSCAIITPQTLGFTPKEVTGANMSLYISDKLKAHANSGLASMSNEFTVNGYGNLAIRKENGFSSQEDASTWLSTNTPTFVLLLAEPQTVQLDPETVTTLLGQNAVFADCGNVSCEYRADVKLYIQKVIS